MRGRPSASPSPRSPSQRSWQTGRQTGRRAQRDPAGRGSRQEGPPPTGRPGRPQGREKSKGTMAVVTAAAEAGPRRRDGEGRGLAGLREGRGGGGGRGPADEVFLAGEQSPTSRHRHPATPARRRDALPPTRGGSCPPLFYSPFCRPAPSYALSRSHRTVCRRKGRAGHGVGRCAEHGGRLVVVDVARGAVRWRRFFCGATVCGVCLCECLRDMSVVCIVCVCVWCSLCIYAVRARVCAVCSVCACRAGG